MKIGSKYKFSELQARHWLQFSEGVGLARAQAKRRILELAKIAATHCAQAPIQSGTGLCWQWVVERILALIEQRCALTIRRLSEPAADAEDVLADS